MNKQRIVIFIILFLILILCGCSGLFNAKRNIDHLTLHSESDVYQAMVIAEDYFNKMFSDCIINSISYDEELLSYEFDFYSTMYEVDKSKIVVFKIIFINDYNEIDFCESVLLKEENKWIVKFCGYP